VTPVGDRDEQERTLVSKAAVKQTFKSRFIQLSLNNELA
jgi:hypothetical protein